MIRAVASICCLAGSLGPVFAQENPEGYRHGFSEELRPIILDLQGNGKAFQFIPRKFTKKVSYKSRYHPGTRITEEHYLTFDLVLPSGQSHNSVFTYKYGDASGDEWNDYWAYALVPPQHPKPDRIEVHFYAGDDTTDEMLRLRFKNGKFIIISRKKPYSSD